MTIGCILFDGKKDTTLSISNRKDTSIVLTYVKGRLSIMDSSHIYYFDMNKWNMENDTIVVGCIKKTTKKHYIGNGHSLIKLKVHNNDYKQLINMLIKYH